MKIVYCVSDLHSTYSKFMAALPKKFDHIYIMGDMFNKGQEQEEMLFWAIKNYNNPKFTFLFGNHEIRFFNELYRSITSNTLDDEYSKSWFETDNHFNIASVAKNLIDKGKIDKDFIFTKFMKNFKWYAIHTAHEYSYILSHASWQLNVSPENQNKKNLIYDTDLLFNQIRKKDNPALDKYATKCKRYQMKHIFGHYSCFKVFKQQAPFINRETFYFIDNGVYKYKNPYYFHPLI